MSPFTARKAPGGSAVTFGSNYPNVEIAFKPGLLPLHGETYPLTQPLATESEIDLAVDNLKEKLEETRAVAKRKLQDYKARAAKG